ncbi:WD40-repeat containing protein [Histomonas meleagridis]|uniref:WD40-repeat containing protein n=1 Tax=Histomonas meleagridis TaxID=135588 RepID=UPI003559FB25|nr:WD40-repeat containing protein [Histomonas meleagridis]KAH0798429.1 WD40-repeat containing protein [Histomonas meleagridis]
MQSYNDTPFQLKRDHPKRQHLCTGALKDERGKYTIEYRPDFALFHEAIMEAKGKPTIFVTFFGSYQTGKSSAIKMLTGDGEVQIDIGDGMRETTYGAFVYGPYSYNKIRQRFGVEIIPEDDTQIFFVDTEGCNGFKAGRPESAVYLLSQLIAPYASISNVVISTIKAGVTAPEVDSMETMFEIINIIRQGVGVESAHLLGLVPNVTNYFPENFVEKQKQITETMQEKFDDFQFGSFKFDEFIPLPIFDTDHDILEQNERFNNAFCIFAQRLIYHIDTSRQSMLLEAEGIFEMFKVLAARTEEQKLSEVAYEALKETKKSSAWKLSKRTVDKIISGKNEEIKKIVAEFKEKLKNDQIFATPILDKDKIINEALQELDEKLPESTKSEKEVYDEFKSRIQREISTEYKKFGRLIKKIKAKQYTFIKDKIATYINNAKPVIYTNIRNNKSTYEDHILNIVQNEAFTFIKNQFLRESNEICKDVQQRNADIVDDLIAIFEPLKLEEDIKTKVKEHIMKIKSQIRNDFFLQVKAIVENNKQSQIREFSNYALNFINSKTSNLRSKLENGNLEVAEINIHSDFRQIENECKRSLLRMYTDNTNQEIIGQVEANISTYLMKSLNNFKECIQEAKRVEMQKQLLKQTLAKTMSNRINELKQKVKSSSATDPNDIIPKNSFENIEKECYQEINKAFPDGKENKELMKYLNNEIISKNKNEMEAIENLKQTTHSFNIYSTQPLQRRYLKDFVNYKITNVSPLSDGTTVAFSTTQISGGLDQKVYICNNQFGENTQIKALNFNEEILSLYLTSRYLLTIQHSSVLIYDIENRIVVLDQSTYNNPNGAGDIVTQGDNYTVAICGSDPCTVYISELTNNSTPIIFKAHEHPIFSMKFSPDGSLISTVSEKGTLIRIFDTICGTQLSVFRRGSMPSKVMSMCFSPDNRSLVVVSESGTVHLFEADVRNGSQQDPPRAVAKLKIEKADMIDSAFISDTEMIIVASSGYMYNLEIREKTIKQKNRVFILLH